jgi:putative heme transporter
VPGSHGDRARVTTVWLRWRRIVLIAVGAAVLVTIVVLSRHTLAESLASVKHLDWTWFLLGLAFEAVSLTAFGLKRRLLLPAEGHEATLRSVMAVTYGGNALSMSVPFAGTQLAAVFTYQQFRRHGLGPAITGWALAVSAILSSSALAVVLVIGAFAGGAPAASAAGFVGAAVFALPAAGVLLGLRFRSVRDWLQTVVARMIRVSQRIFRRPRVSADDVEEFLDRVASIKLSRPRYAGLFALALLNWLADCSCLACTIRATGEPIPWQGLLLAYGAGVAVGSTGFTPGGFGLVEVTLTAALTAAGLGAAHALTAVLAYRLISFWAILVGGWIAVLVLTNRHGPAEQARIGYGERAGSPPAGEPAAGARDRRQEDSSEPDAGDQEADGGDAGKLTQAGKFNQDDLMD